MEAPKPRTLEVTVQSAARLHVNGKPVTKNVFVVVRAESITSHTTTMSGGDGGEGGSHSWNDKFFVELATHARSITFEVKYKTENGIVKDIGVARIAFSEFLGGSVSDYSLQCLSYRLRDWDGLQNGVINFSVRVVEPPFTDEGPCNEVVTGNPISWNNGATSSSSNV